MSSDRAMLWNQVPAFERKLPAKYGPKLRCASTRGDERGVPSRHDFLWFALGCGTMGRALVIATS
jgi:hypothetical protein